MARILVYAFDLGEASQIRRVRSLIAAGHAVTTASMRRGNMNRDFQPDWPDIPLFTTENERLLRRVVVIARSVARMWGHRDVIADSDLVIARNFDMAVIAWAAGLGLRGPRPLVYECLDIHGVFTRRGALGAVMRWCERRMLGRIHLLLTSSPGFVRHYFEPVQGYAGPVAIVENKLWFDEAPPPRPAVAPGRAPRPVEEVGRAPRPGEDARPIILGWVGSIRCAPSLALLMAVADAMGPEVRIEIHGNLHGHALPDFRRAIDQRRNVAYHGPYTYPHDLARIYGGCDLVWAQDMWQRGGNSDWLLPNRIYEAAWFGCPCLALADTETGRRIEAGGLGFTVVSADATEVAARLRSVGQAGLAAARVALLARDGAAFRLMPEDLNQALAPVLPDAQPAPPLR